MSKVVAEQDNASEAFTINVSHSYYSSIPFRNQCQKYNFTLLIFFGFGLRRFDYLGRAIVLLFLDKSNIFSL